MKSIEVKSFSNADEVVDVHNNAYIQAVSVGGQRIVKLTLQPGWKWSVDVKPNVGTNTCQAAHLEIINKGTICCIHDDGTEATYTAGDAYSIEPGHDAWVVGDEVAEAIEFAGVWGE
ncbi:MAG: cupin domain-containing protein [Proteobacteria bacterium]|nr:cupin domain-containing protein [Pseudomonadota bacterium]MDA1037418.1 cupin domain-containing protein [Pseudomonadota bacterium]